MVVYQCIVAAAETAAYVTDGSHLTNLQVGVLTLIIRRNYHASHVFEGLKLHCIQNQESQL